MRENQLSPFSKAAVSLLLGFAFVAAVSNVVHGTVVNPRAFSIVMAGFVCFLVGKVSVIAQGRWVSFGTAAMSEGMANMYRLGYWLMAVGVLMTFL